jgi:hypothetical protein
MVRALSGTTQIPSPAATNPSANCISRTSFKCLGSSPYSENSPWTWVEKFGLG